MTFPTNRSVIENRLYILQPHNHSRCLWNASFLLFFSFFFTLRCWCFDIPVAFCWIIWCLDYSSSPATSLNHHWNWTADSRCSWWAIWSYSWTHTHLIGSTQLYAQSFSRKMWSRGFTFLGLEYTTTPGVSFLSVSRTTMYDLTGCLATFGA